MKITTHKELAELIAGKRILHMNSLGKDSTVCLEWLTRFAYPAHIVSAHYQFLGSSSRRRLVYAVPEKTIPRSRIYLPAKYDRNKSDSGGSLSIAARSQSRIQPIRLLRFRPQNPDDRNQRRVPLRLRVRGLCKIRILCASVEIL